MNHESLGTHSPKDGALGRERSTTPQTVQSCGVETRKKWAGNESEETVNVGSKCCISGGSA